MSRFIVRRILFAIFVVLTVLTAVFFLTFGIGDPCTAKLGERARAEQINSCKEDYGFDKPMPQQFGSFLGVAHCIRPLSPNYDNGEGYCGLLQGDMAESMSHREPVLEVLKRRLPRTLLLGAIAMFFEIIFGLTIGIFAAVRRQTWFDTGFMALAFLGISLPSFLTGLIFLDLFAFRMGLFPVGGYGDGFFDHVYHALLPAFTLAIIGAATYARIMRSEMIDQLRSDYVRTATAKGLSEWKVILGHAARNAMLPIVTLMGLNLTLLVSGAVITESIYAWPGMGKLAIESIVNLDVWVIMGVVLFASTTVQVGNLLADIGVASLDPRVRIDGES